MKTFKTSCRKVKISISLRGGSFQFSARGGKYMYLKKMSPQGELHLANVPLNSLVVFREIKSFHKSNTSISSQDTLVNVKKLHFITKKIYDGR